MLAELRGNDDLLCCLLQRGKTPSGKCKWLFEYIYVMRIGGNEFIETRGRTFEQMARTLGLKTVPHNPGFLELELGPIKGCAIWISGKGDKADSEISEVVVPQEGGPSPFHGHLWDASVPEARRVRAWGIAPAPRVGGQVVSLQFSKRRGGGEAGGRGQGADVRPEGWMGTRGGRSDGRTYQLTSVP